MKKGDHIEKYIVLRPLGKGGEGSVYLAAHSQTHQLRALKELPRTAGRASYHEVRVLRRMHHSSLPDILDVIETETSVILVMEYIRGQNLEELLCRKYRFSQQQVTDAGIQIGEALRYLHSRTPPVLHLDIKPANIICQPDGRLVLVDFGAALRENDEAHDESGGSIRRGTDGYAPPELYMEDCEPDVRADLYELGASMYHMVSGKVYSPVLYKGRVPGCSDVLSDVIRRCLSPAPEGRYPDAGTFLEDIRRSVRRKRREHTRIQGYAALLLTLGSGFLAVNCTLPQLQATTQEEWNYERLVQEAGIVPAAEGEELLHRAVFLDPVNEAAYLRLLEIYAADNVLSDEEDRRLRELLHTVPVGSPETYEELLRSDPLAYGTVCSSLGYLYRFTCAQTEAEYIAGGWFEKAVTAVDTAETETVPDWYRAAALYARLCARGSMSDLETRADTTAFAMETWTDLTQLAEAMLNEKNSDILSAQLKSSFWLWMSEEALAQAAFLPEESRLEKIDSMTGLLDKALLQEKPDVRTAANIEQLRTLAETFRISQTGKEGRN